MALAGNEFAVALLDAASAGALDSSDDLGRVEGVQTGSGSLVRAAGPTATYRCGVQRRSMSCKALMYIISIIFWEDIFVRPGLFLD